MGSWQGPIINHMIHAFEMMKLTICLRKIKSTVLGPGVEHHSLVHAPHIEAGKVS